MTGTKVPRIQWPARLVLVTFVVIAVVPSTAVSVYLFLRYAESQRHQAESSLIESAKGVARAIDSEFASALTGLNILQTTGLLDSDNLAPLKQRLVNTTLSTGRGFVLLDASGNPIINTVAAPRFPLTGNAIKHMIVSLKARVPFISDVTRDTNTGETLTYLGVPIVRNGVAHWYLVTFLYGADFKGLVDQPGVPENWVVSIVDPHGTHIRRSHRNDQFAGHSLVPELVKHMATGGTGVVRTTSLEGTALISTVAYAPRYRWAAALGLPVEQLEAPLRSSLRSLILVGFLLAVLSMALVYVILRILDKGFQTLRRSTRLLRSGNIVEMQHSPIREFDDVSATMTRVSQELVKYHTDLEAKVIERTDQLLAEMQRREHSENQLRQLQKMEAIGKLTGGIAHDFNNMLAVVIGALSLMQQRLARGDNNIGKFIESAIQGAESAATLTRGLLAFSRQQPLNPEPLDCNKLIAGMSELLRHTIREDIEIETVLGGGVWRVHLDVAGLESAILNIAVNARDAMPDGGKLTIETNNAHLDDAYASENPDVVPGQYVLVAITDTGTGMPEEVLANVFEPFFTTKRIGHGTGLGLSQVHGFIKQSGGHIKIYSELGEGTIVKLYLPRLMTEFEERASLPVSSVSSPRATKNEKILVVEDDAHVRSGTVSMLEELGYAVIEAEGGVEALQLLESHPDVALIVTDVVMPGMNGRELFEKATKKYPALRVLFTTGYTRNAIVHNGTLDPGMQLLSKPFTMATLAQKVAAMLSIENRT